VLDCGPWNRASDLPPLWRDLWEERSAIMEFDANLDRRTAEREALRDVNRVFGHPPLLGNKPFRPRRPDVS